MLSEFLFDGKISEKKKIDIYNIFRQMDENKIYKRLIIEENTDNSNDISKFIYDNYEKMSIEEMRRVISKCLTENGIRYILLNFEMRNLKYETKDTSLREFELIATKFINRYHGKAGGFLFKNDWILMKENTKEQNIVDIHKNEIVYMNIIQENDLHSDETVEYLQNIVRILTRISFRVKVSIHSKFSVRDKINYIFIKCTEIKFD
jgi:hypothetical protein